MWNVCSNLKREDTGSDLPEANRLFNLQGNSHSGKDFSLNLVNTVKFHFTKHTQAHARKIKTCIFAHDWMTEVKIPGQNKYPVCL